MLILFSIRLDRLKRVTGRATAAAGAVEGILALVMQCIKRTSSKLLRLGFAAMDIAFICGFIIVADLTSPKHYTGAYSCLGSWEQHD